LVGIYGPVTITQPLAVSTPSVNFATGGQVFFTAKFQNSAVWTITITEPNGAKKTINGISKEINAENSTWVGTADVLPEFIVGTVTATLSFQNDPSVTNNTSFSVTGKHISGNSSDVLVSDFVVEKGYCYCALCPTCDIPPGNWARDFPKFNNTESVYGYPDGNPYLIMGDTSHPYNTNSARPWQGNGSPYVDIVTISPRNSQINYGTYYPLYADPTKVYFNIMVYNTGTPTWLEISFYEVEPVVKNGTAKPDRHLTIKPDWVGWKLISVKYSDLIPNSNDAIGNIQPQKITDIQIVMLSNLSPSDPAMPNTPIKTALDHIIFTHNAPYQP